MSLTLIKSTTNFNVQTCCHSFFFVVLLRLFVLLDQFDRVRVCCFFLSFSKPVYFYTPNGLNASVLANPSFLNAMIQCCRVSHVYRSTKQCDPKCAEMDFDPEIEAKLRKTEREREEERWRNREKLAPKSV